MHRANRITILTQQQISTSVTTHLIRDNLSLLTYYCT